MTALDPGLRDKYLVDPYADWVGAEGAPIITAPSIDLFAVETKHWPRFDAGGAVIHVDGRCDFLTLFVFDVAANANMKPVRHVYEELVYVLKGSGETEVVLSNGERRVFEWRQGSLFTAPVNALCTHRAGGAGARLASFNDARYLMGLYRNEGFLFANPAAFAQRQARGSTEPWTLDLPDMPLKAGDEGAYGDVRLADCALGGAVVDLSRAQSTLARRQMQGAHLLCVAGEGATLSFSDDASPITRTPWRAGTVIGLPGMTFHQHMACSETARFIIVELGSHASPLFRSRRAAYGDTTVYASGAAVVPRSAESDALKVARGA